LCCLDNLLLKRNKYLATDVKPNIITTISQVPAIDDKTIKKKENKIPAAPTSTYSNCIEGKLKIYSMLTYILDI